MTYRPLPESLTIKSSGIEGLGLFATQDIKAGTQLGVTHIIISDDIIRLPLGGFINHTDNPNCVRINVANKSYLHTLKDIKQDEELTLKYVMYRI
jgi:SET domain-containing protein|tara:strand:- start:230 stop:514 length:285 start_codon:yes stop_codon:yes gene_type:complete